MEKKNYSRSNDVEKELNNRQPRSTGRNTKEHEVEQELKKENSLAWEQDGITYLDGRIYIPNNRKIKE